MSEVECIGRFGQYEVWDIPSALPEDGRYSITDSEGTIILPGDNDLLRALLLISERSRLEAAGAEGTDDSLSRLSAGLDRDTQLARAATELPKITPRYPEKRPPWEPEEWVPARDDVRTVNGAADPVLEDGGTRSRAVAALIAEFDPARALRQADVIRKVLADAHDPKTFDTDHLGGSVDYDSFREGVEAATDLFVHALASIYTDEATEERP